MSLISTFLHFLVSSFPISHFLVPGLITTLYTSVYIATSQGPKKGWYTLFSHAFNPPGIQGGLDTIGTRPDTLMSLYNCAFCYVNGYILCDTVGVIRTLAGTCYVHCIGSKYALQHDKGLPLVEYCNLWYLEVLFCGSDIDLVCR